EVTTTRLAMIGLSLVAVLAPRADAIAARAAAWRTRLASPELALAAIAGSAIAAHALAPRGVLVKLALAYALVLAGHAALREALAGAAFARRLRLLGALAAAALALAAYDTGVTVAIAGIGLALAMIVAGHDAMYDAS